MTHTITTGSDAGGFRQFLDGKPLHAGTMIDVFFPEQWIWIAGRYEWSFRADAPACVVIPDVGNLMLRDDVTVRRRGK